MSDSERPEDIYGDGGLFDGSERRWRGEIVLTGEYVFSRDAAYPFCDIATFGLGISGDDEGVDD